MVLLIIIVITKTIPIKSSFIIFRRPHRRMSNPETFLMTHFQRRHCWEGISGQSGPVCAPEVVQRSLMH